jgi:EAL domain-containing protein (putative c-di-GMP-specific phosphodiesterase class I)
MTPVDFELYSPMKSVDESATAASGIDSSIWFLTGQTHDSEHVRHISIRSTPFSVGRRSDSSLHLAYNCVSKKHAELLTRQDELWVRDLASTNGTYVNGQRITSQAQLQSGDIVQFATVVFRVGRTESLQEELTNVGTIHENTFDHALALVQLERLINERAVVPYFQPIVHLQDPSLSSVAYEVLGRSNLFGLTSPTEMFRTASQLNLETQLSRVFRSQGLELAQAFDSDTALFINTHPAELLEPDLLDSIQELRNQAQDRPLVLEIHEAAVTNPRMIRSLRDGLNACQIQLAFDDFGAGQARLLELAHVRPDYIKFDMKLIQGIHQAPASRQQVVALLVRMVNELEIAPIAEGVETAEDHEALRQMGVRMGQGYFYGRPSSISHIVSKPNAAN